MKSQKQIKDKIQRERRFLLAIREKCRLCSDGSRERFAYQEMAARQEGMIQMLRWVLK